MNQATSPVDTVDQLAPLRAWVALVWLSLRRQARARQMVWIALALLVFMLGWVGVNGLWGRWGMHHWRSPRRVGPSYMEWLAQTQSLTGMAHPSAGAHGIEHAILGSCQVILAPGGRTVTGEPLACSAFQVFSQTAILGVFLSFLLPMWSLSFATEALGGERESGSMIWLLSRPLPRPAIYLAKFVALLPWSLGFNLGGFTLICLAAGPPGRLALLLYWPAVLWATLAFAALFLLVGATFRRPAVVAIVYSFLLEVVLGNMPGYLKRVSVGFYARCMMYEQASAYGIQAERSSVFLPVDGTTAAFVLILATVVLVAAGMLIFSRKEYHEVE